MQTLNNKGRALTVTGALTIATIKKLGFLDKIGEDYN